VGRDLTTAPPAVTVIIPTYNSRGTLELALESVRRQTFPDFEAWVVGDGCTDGSDSVVAALGDERFRWLNLAANSGTPSRPRNEALGRARGRYVAYLGHDDLWFPGHLAGLVGAAEAGGCDFVHSLGAVVGPDGAAGFFSLPAGRFDLGVEYSPSNWLHRRELIARIGPWSTRALVSNDLEFLDRVFRSEAVRGFRDELSALKFPAVYWKMYSLGAGAEPSQARYLVAMAADAPGLRDRLLREASAAISRKSSGSGVARILAAKLLGPARYFLRLHAYQRWPLNRLASWRYRRRAGLD